MANNQLSDNILGVIDIMLGRAEGMQRVDLTSRGFWISFYALVIAGLIDSASLSLSYPTAVAGLAEPVPGKLQFIVGNMVAALLAYASGMLALFLLCRNESEKIGFPNSLAVHNWASPVVSALVLPFLLISLALRTGAEPSGVETLLFFGLISILVLAGVRLLRISLSLSPLRAALYFGVTTFVSISIGQGVEALLGV